MARKSKAPKRKEGRRVRALPGSERAKKADPLAALVAAGAAALALPIDKAWRVSVQRNLEVILKHAERVDQFQLPDDVQPGPVFRA
jgi:Protein of unknown function (DUF4089)